MRNRLLHACPATNVGSEPDGETLEALSKALCRRPTSTRARMCWRKSFCCGDCPVEQQRGVGPQGIHRRQHRTPTRICVLSAVPAVEGGASTVEAECRCPPQAACLVTALLRATAPQAHWSGNRKSSVDVLEGLMRRWRWCSASGLPFPSGDRRWLAWRRPPALRSVSPRLAGPGVLGVQPSAGRACLLPFNPASP